MLCINIHIGATKSIRIRKTHFYFNGIYTKIKFPKCLKIKKCKAKQNKKEENICVK